MTFYFFFELCNQIKKNKDDKIKVINWSMTKAIELLLAYRRLRSYRNEKIINTFSSFYYKCTWIVTYNDKE